MVSLLWHWRIYWIVTPCPTS